MKNISTKVLVVFFLYFLNNLSLASQTCVITINNQGTAAPKSASKKSRRQPIDSLEAFGEAMSKGLILQENQADLFDVYRKVFLGDPTFTILDRYNLKYVYELLREHPELRKPLYREFEIATVQKVYSTPEALSRYIKSLQTVAGQLRSNLFQVQANLGFWKKLLSYKEPVFSEDTLKLASNQMELSKDELKALKKDFAKKARDEFEADLEEFVPKDLQLKLNEESISYVDKVKHLYSALKSIEAHLAEKGADLKLVRQTMVDLVASAGLNNGAIIELLKRKNALDKIDGLNKALEEREQLAKALGVSDGYQGLLQQLGVEASSLSQTVTNESEFLRQIEVEILKTAPEKVMQGVERVRSLSIQEAPFRSCLGKDCSTNTYFSKAFDPNFQYFTLTDSKSHSLGHATIVLGTAKSESGADVKVAFVDKLQNIPNQSIDYFLEAIRRTFLETGYILVLPVDVGGHNGLANEQYTRDFVHTQILPKLESEVLVSFTPHSHKYSFANSYSRAYDRLSVRAFMQTSSLESKEILPGQKYRIRLANKKLNRDAFIKEILQKRDSKDDSEVLKFINNNSLMNYFEEVGLYSREEFQKDLENLIRDSQRSFMIRKTAYLQLLLSKFTPNQYYFAQSLVDAEEIGFTLAERTQMGSEIRQWANSNDDQKRNFFSLCGTSWFRAVDNNDSESLKKLLSLSVIDVNATNSSGESALLHALEVDRFEIARLLLSNGKVKKPTYDQIKHIIFNNVLRNNVQNFEDLYNWGLIDLSENEFEGRTILQLAIENGLTQIVKKIIKLDPQQMLTSFESGFDLISHALAFGHNEIATILEEKGAKSNQSPLKDWTSLYPKLEFIDVDTASVSNSAGSFAVASTPITQQFIVQLFGTSAFGLRQSTGLNQVTLRDDKLLKTFLPNHPVDNLSYSEAEKIIKKINEWSESDQPEIYKLIADHKKGDHYDMMTKEQMDVVLSLAKTEDGQTWETIKQNEEKFSDYVTYNGNSTDPSSVRSSIRTIKSVFKRKPFFMGDHPIFDLRGNVSTWIKSGSRLGYLWGQAKLIYGSNSFSQHWEVSRNEYQKLSSSSSQGVGLRLVRLGTPKKEKTFLGF